MVVLPGNRGELRLLPRLGADSHGRRALLEFSAEDRVPDEAMLLLLLLLPLLPMYRCRWCSRRMNRFERLQLVEG